MSSFQLVFVLQSLCLFHLTVGLPLSEFYPFGNTMTLDQSLAPTDDDASRIQLSNSIPFFGVAYNSVFVNNNGLLSFGTSVSTYTPLSFPLSDDHRLIAPYWADVDTRTSGTVWFRVTNDATILSRINREIGMTDGANFQPNIAVIVTWDSVGYYHAHSESTNTFQCVLASDGSLSYAIFLYGDDEIQWTTGDNSGGNYGVGGTPALVGVNAGDGVQSVAVPQSLTPAIVNIAMTSNVGRPGVWIFQINQERSGPRTFCRSEEIFSYGITYVWPKISIGSSARFVCTKNPKFSVSRKCNDGGMWDDFDEKGCGVLAGQLEALLSTILTIDNLGEFLSRFSAIIAQSTENAVDQTADNLKLISDIFGNVANFVVESDVSISDGDIGTNVVRAVDSLVQWTPTAIKATSGSSVIGSFEDIASVLIEQIPGNSSQSINFTSLTLVSEKFTLKDLETDGRNFQIIGGKHLTLPSQNETQIFSQSDFEASIQLPGSLFENITDSDSIGIFFTFYDMPTLFPLGERNTIINGSGDVEKEVKIGTPVIASTVGGNMYTIDNLAEPVEISFRITEEYIVSDSERCVSWDFDIKDWTRRGCMTTKIQDRVILCRCSHLTNFAVLVDICLRQEDCQPSKVETALTYISYIGMTTSIVSLVFTLIVLLSHRRIRQKTISKYHIQLSLSLLFMLVVSLALVVLSAQNITPLYEGCVTVSALVHYFTLVAVMWMGAEALFMFQKLVLVFTEITTKYVIIVSIVCWGLPIIPVIIPIIIDLTNGTEPGSDIVIQRSDSVSFCFISHFGVFWGAFLAPILTILVFNLITFIWIAVVLILHARRTSTRKMEGRNHRSTIQLMISIGGVMFLFGITWLFAILTFSLPGLRETFQILFTIFNSLQGFFIFLFFCAISKEARESWKELFGSGQQSELINTPTSNSDVRASYRRNVNGFKIRRTKTDTSTVKMMDYHNKLTLKTDKSRKDSWSLVISGKSETLPGDSRMLSGTYEHNGLQMSTKVVTDRHFEVPKKTYSDNITSRVSTTGIGTEQTNFTGNEDNVIKKAISIDDNSSLTSSVIDTVSESTCTNPSRKTSEDNASLKIQIKQNQNMKNDTYTHDVEMAIEEMAVVIHSDNSSESSDEDTEL